MTAEVTANVHLYRYKPTACKEIEFVTFS